MLQLKREQKIFIDSLEGIGDILVFDTKRKKGSEYIKDSLWKILDNSKKFFQIQYSYPERFEKLLFLHELLELNQTNKLQASANLFFDVKKYLVSVTAIVNQFLRIREAATEVHDFEMRRFATYNLIWMLRLLSQGEDRSKIIQTILQILTNLRYTQQPIEDQLEIYFMWYIDVVFKSEFKLEYLSLFDQDFIQCTHEIVSENKSKLFNILVSSLHDRIYVNSSVKEVLSEVLYKSEPMSIINKKIQPKIKELSILENQLQTLPNLKECLKLCDDVKHISKVIIGDISDHQLQSELQHKYDELLEQISENLESRFKLNHLIYLTFNLGAWCIFKEHFDYLYYLWEYQQPKDADATWVGSAIIPKSLPKLFNLYFRTSLGESISSIRWEDHRGSSRYYDLYFLILILRHFLNQKGRIVLTDSDRKNQIDSFEIPNRFEASRLKNIQYIVDNRLLLLADELNSWSEKLNILNFDTNQLSNSISQGLIPFLESLKDKSEQRIQELIRDQKISNVKIKEFKQDFLKSYYEQASVRNLFEFLGLYTTRLNELDTVDKNLQQIGYNRINEKEIFFEEWHGHSGVDFGQGLGRTEDSRLLIKTMKASVKTTITLDEVINTFDGNKDDLIVINIYPRSEQLFNNNKFKTKSYLDEAEKNLDLVKTSGFIGFYIYSINHKIPIFEYFPLIDSEAGIPKNSLLIVDKSHLGKLTQYSPVEDITSYEIEDHIAFRIEAFAENDTLMHEVLYNKCPDWIESKGDKTQQEVFLQSQVLIEIYERFSLELDPAFVGFLIPDTKTTRLQDFEL